MMLTKTNMFGGDDGAEIEHLLPVEGRLHQGADVGRDPARSRSSSTPTASATTSTRSTRAISEQGWGGTRMTFDDDKDRRDQDDHREDPQGPAEVGPRQHRHRQPGRRRRRRQPGTERAGAAGRRLHRRPLVELADDIVPDPGQAQGTARRARRHRRPEQRAVGARRSRARGGVRLQRAGGGAASSAWRCAARRCASSVAATPKCRCGCASPAPRTTASRTCASFTVRAPDGRTVPLLSMVDVTVQPSATADPARQPPDHAGDPGQPRRQGHRCPKRARRWRRR